MKTPIVPPLSLFLFILVSSACGSEPVGPDCPAATAPGTSVWATRVSLDHPYSAVFVLDPGGKLRDAAGPEIEAALEEHFFFTVFWREDDEPRVDTLHRLALLPEEAGCPEVVDSFATIRDTALVASWASSDGCHPDIEVAGRLGARHVDWAQVLELASAGRAEVAADLAVGLVRGAIEDATVPYGQVVAIVDGVYYEPVRCASPGFRDYGPWRAGDDICFLGGKPRAYNWLLALRDEPLE